MNRDETIKVLEYMVQYHDNEQEKEAIKIAVDVLKGEKTPGFTEIINEAVHGVIDELYSIGDKSHYDFRSYIAGVSALTDYLLDD